MNTVHAILVNWNGGTMLLDAVESVFRSRGVTVRTHVVDNGSTDGSDARVLDAFPEVDLWRAGKNLGFAAGANVGIRRALAEGAAYVFLLNNDATLETDTLEKLVLEAEEVSDAGLLSGRIYLDQKNDVLWCCGVTLGFWPNLCRLRGHGRRGRGRYPGASFVDSLTGCGLLIKRAVFETIGFLDEDYFVYVEDADFCVRARRAGFRCRYVPEAVMEHRASQSTGGGYAPGRKYLTGYGSGLFLRRHGSLKTWGSFLFFDVLLYPLLLVTALPRGRGRGALAKGRGLWDGLTGKPVNRRVLERSPA